VVLLRPHHITAGAIHPHHLTTAGAGAILHLPLHLAGTHCRKATCRRMLQLRLRARRHRLRIVKGQIRPQRHSMVGATQLHHHIMGPAGATLRPRSTGIRYRRMMSRSSLRPSKWRQQSLQRCWPHPSTEVSAAQGTSGCGAQITVTKVMDKVMVKPTSIRPLRT